MSRRYSASGTPRPPLDSAGLEALAIGYLGKYATTRLKLRQYLRRKLAERGWAGEGEAPVDNIVDRAAERGYVDDAAFAEARSASLTRRGYGARRVAQSLHAAGIAPPDAVAAHDLAAREALASALGFARRRRIGPYARAEPDDQDRRRAIAAMIRAGHSLEIARRIVFAGPGSEIDG